MKLSKRYPMKLKLISATPFHKSKSQTQAFVHFCFSSRPQSLFMVHVTFIASSPFVSNFGKSQNGLPVDSRRQTVSRRQKQKVRCSAKNSDIDPEEEMRRLGQEREMMRMRERLAGLFGTESSTLGRTRGEEFDGEALREVILAKWGRTFDVQPAKRSNRVYLQVMWRFQEQQSFYLDEEGFASHLEAVAQLLNEWNAVDFVCDYIANVKKRRTLSCAVK